MELLVASSCVYIMLRMNMVWYLRVVGYLFEREYVRGWKL